MKRILIPTDFSISSLNIVKSALEQLEDDAHHITLIVGRESSNSISDLLFYSKEKVLKELITADFIDAIQLIQNRYSTKISSISYDVLHSQNKNYIRNYVEANNIELLVLPDQLAFTKRNKKSINLIPILAKLGVNTMFVEWDREDGAKETNNISDLFFHSA